MLLNFKTIKSNFNFLDSTVTNNQTNSYDVKFFRKLVITNVQIKSNSNISVATFKGFLARAYKIYSKHNIDQESQFLINILTENGYERIIKMYFNEMLNPPVTDMSNNEDTNKIVKFS